MPSHDLFSYFQRDLVLEQSWYLPGTHYAQTLEAWLKLQDKHGARFLAGDSKLLDGKTGDDGKTVFYRFRWARALWFGIVLTIVQALLPVLCGVLRAGQWRAMGSRCAPRYFDCIDLSSPRAGHYLFSKRD